MPWQNIGMGDVVIPRQLCPCGGAFGMRYAAGTGRYILWHDSATGKGDRADLGQREFDALGGFKQRIGIIADFATAQHPDEEPYVPYNTVMVNPQFTDPATIVTGVRERPDERPWQGNKGLPSTRPTGELRESCARCGGAIGFRYRAEWADYLLWHRAKGSDTEQNKTVGVDRLRREGTTPFEALVAFADEAHDEDERERQAAMLAQREADRKNPARWPTLQGKRLCATGKLDKWDRVGIERAIIRAGGVWTDKVDRSTDAVVVGVRPGSVKLAAIRRNSIPTLDEAQFAALYQRSLDAANAKPLILDQEFDPVIRPFASRPIAVSAGLDGQRAVGVAGDGRIVVEGRDGLYRIAGEAEPYVGYVTIRDGDGDPARVQAPIPGRITGQPLPKNTAPAYGAGMRQARPDPAPAPAPPKPRARKPRGVVTVEEMIDRERYSRSERR